MARALMAIAVSPKLFCELACAFRPRQGLLCLHCRRAGRGEVQIRRSEFAARGQGLEDCDGTSGRALALCRPARAPEEFREPAEDLAFPERVAEHPAVFERLLQRGDSLLVLIGHEALPGEVLEMLGTLGRREPFAEPDRPRVLRCRLAVRPHRRRPGGGGRREAQNCVRVVGLLGMVGETCRVGRPGAAGERGYCLTVQLDLPVQRHRRLDR